MVAANYSPGDVVDLHRNYKRLGVAKDDERRVAGVDHRKGTVTLEGPILLEQNDEWAVQRARYMTLESIAPVSDNPTVKLPAAAA